MIVKEIKTELFAECWQFIIQDEKAEGDLGDAWTKEAGARLLATGLGIIGIGTVSHNYVPVTIKLFDGEPDLLTEAAIGQINECDLRTNSDKLVVYGIGDDFEDAISIDVEPGLYRVRIYYGNVDKPFNDAVERDDFYETHLWPTRDRMGVKIIKSRHNKTTYINGFHKNLSSFEFDD